MIAIALLFVGLPVARVIMDKGTGASSSPDEIVTGSQIAASAAREPEPARAVRQLQSRYLSGSQIEVWGAAKVRDGSELQVFLSNGNGAQEVAVLRMEKRRFHTVVRIPSGMRGKLEIGAFVTPR